MAEARQRDNWAHTSAILALTANCNRDPKKTKQPFQPSDFDPFAREEKSKEFPELERERAFRRARAIFKGETILEKK